MKKNLKFSVMTFMLVSSLSFLAAVSMLVLVLPHIVHYFSISKPSININNYHHIFRLFFVFPVFWVEFISKSLDQNVLDSLVYFFSCNISEYCVQMCYFLSFSMLNNYYNLQSRYALHPLDRSAVLIVLRAM